VPCFSFLSIFAYLFFNFACKSTKKAANNIDYCGIFVSLPRLFTLKTIKEMKVFRVLFMAAALMMASGASAQTVYNANGSSCGKIESNGTVRNGSGSSIGKIESNGVVRNGSGSQIGKIDSDGTIRNSSGSSIGKVDRDGTVRNSSGSSIGKVESDGTVRNGSGSSIGKLQGVPKEWVAAYFFFFF
jgi:hypothetical protein